MRNLAVEGWLRLKPALNAAAILLGVAACSDGVGPGLRGATVRIYLGSDVFDEQTVAVDSVFALTAQILDSTGKPIPGEIVFWSSDRPEVASVDGSGVVVAKAVGTANITARHRVGEDVARINVAAAVTGPIACTEDDEVDLEVGQVLLVEGEDAVLTCLPAGDANAEYTVVTVNTGRSAGSTLPVNLRATGVTAVTGPPNPNLIPSGLPARIDQAARFHQMIREGSSKALEGRLRSGVATQLSSGPSFQLFPGQIVSLNVSTDASGGCSSVDTRHGRVIHVGERVIIVADTMNPAGGFSNADYLEFGNFFDDHAWPLVTGTFGTPSDIDRNGRAIVFFTVAVNELPANNNLPQNSGSYVGGFFYNRDLFPRSSCEGSNVAEMFYMLVPDPIGESRPGGRRPFGLNFVKNKIPTLLVHEFQHLVNDSRRLHVNSAPVWEETWLNEGLSHIAEELMFYEMAPGMEPGQNLRPASFAETLQREAFYRFQQDNHDRFALFIREPSDESVLGEDMLATRGAAWAFLRYLADLSHPNEGSLWEALVTGARKAGLENLDEALDGTTRERLRDWAVALYLDDTGLANEARYETRSWNYRAMFTEASRLFPRSNEPYPLRVRTLFNDQNRYLTLPGGSFAYFRVGVPAGGRAAVRVTVGATADGPQLPPPSRLKIAVVRTK